MRLQEFLKDSRRKVMLCNKISVGNTILRNMNINESTDALDVKVLTLSNIAEELVTAYDAYRNQEMRTLVDSDTACKYMEKALLSGNYANFPAALITDATVKDVLCCVNELRLNGTTQAWSSSTDSKIADIKNIFDSYESLLRNASVLDGAMMILEANRIAEEEKDLVAFLLPWLKKTLIGNLSTNI